MTIPVYDERWMDKRIDKLVFGREYPLPEEEYGILLPHSIKLPHYYINILDAMRITTAPNFQSIKITKIESSIDRSQWSVTIWFTRANGDSRVDRGQAVDRTQASAIAMATLVALDKR